MPTKKLGVYPELLTSIEKARQLIIPEDRIRVLNPLIEYIQSKIDQGQEINLNFICTHNSRRSQFSQIWAQTAADYFGIPANCYSGGVEITAFNERAVASIKRSGFKVSAKGDANPVYYVFHSDDKEAITAFSKLFNDPINKGSQFAAVITCSHADENCPFIPGTEKRIPVRYEDPKEFDNTSEESAKYDERSLQIASEMFYVFSNVKMPA
ncbi:protein-tyrosine-phosphatase [Algoriphagus limi]|uniref:Protein-tyrosine-phosphatase n=1 Tax=Algoriphagus limi TaxID=2975273 RepID=A0ABT2G2X5_9BACT|nr:protein-tyrosine-phosphatase [Algoriphagus limi]MCS5489417.1 protein-tyrosine-phosphatase [Algoriphagus limi]